MALQDECVPGHFIGQPATCNLLDNPRHKLQTPIRTNDFLAVFAIIAATEPRSRFIGQPEREEAQSNDEPFRQLVQ